ncbi:uncharacterized protein LOC120161439 [Hibiscus syriacus]|uniref:uncharacterized protein LOC120161439 n=1 Tax=Hibiscus syriacus TaxID=106335 RepID=UPI001921B9F3|nr:uncharacterized protein LOC120161439 [Hibiscus syriacus]
MDQTENWKQQSLSQFMKSRFHRRLTHLFLSVSVFSLFFSYSYWPSLLHSFNFNFHDSLPFQLFSHAIDKNCIFLVCNGLLVFLAKYSGLISSSSMYNDDDPSFNSYEDVPRADQSVDLEPKAPLLDDKATLESTVDEAIKNSVEIVEEEEDNKRGLEITVEEEEDGVLSTEDLNKRFDEFIAKMKEELRTEAGQQLVTV